LPARPTPPPLLNAAEDNDGDDTDGIGDEEEMQGVEDELAMPREILAIKL
jgi:hypothetical protein